MTSGKRSSLSRMFSYAAGGGVENFTTEAFAAAIRARPEPFVFSLATINIQFKPPFREVATQVSINAGTLGLLVVDSNNCRVIIEVKVDAPESGNQLERYRRWADSFPPEQRPHVVVLSPGRLPSDSAALWLPWQRLWDHTRNGQHGHQWTDLARWMEERGMADRSFEPVDDREAHSLRAAHSLMRKAARILLRPSQALNEAWPGSNWPAAANDVKKQLYSRFATWPSYSVQHRTPYKCGCTIGIYSPTPEESARLSMWVWAPRKALGERDAITAKATSLPPPWQLVPESGEMLRADKPLLDFSDHEEASNWLLVRIAELCDSGMFRVFEGSGAGDAEESPDDSGGNCLDTRRQGPPGTPL